MIRPGEKIPEQTPGEPMERLLEDCLLKAAKTDEGNRGIILELDVNSLPEGWRKELLGEDTDLTDNTLAVKIIKIFLPGNIEHEAHMQRKASDLIASQENQDDYAKVPHAYRSKEITIHDKELLYKLKE